MVGEKLIALPLSSGPVPESVQTLMANGLPLVALIVSDPVPEIVS